MLSRSDSLAGWNRLHRRRLQRQPAHRGRRNGPLYNGGAEAVDLLVEKTRRLAGFRSLANCWLWSVLVANGYRPYRPQQNHA